MRFVSDFMRSNAARATAKPSISYNVNEFMSLITGIKGRK